MLCFWFYVLFYYENSKQTGTSTNWFSYSTDILFKGFMNIYKKCTAKPFSFFIIHGTFASDNLSCFRKNLLEKKLKLIVAIDDKIKDKKSTIWY